MVNVGTCVNSDNRLTKPYRYQAHTCSKCLCACLPNSSLKKPVATSSTQYIVGTCNIMIYIDPCWSLASFQHNFQTLFQGLDLPAICQVQRRANHHRTTPGHVTRLALTALATENLHCFIRSWCSSQSAFDVSKITTTRTRTGCMTHLCPRLVPILCPHYVGPLGALVPCQRLIQIFKGSIGHGKKVEPHGSSRKTGVLLSLCAPEGEDKIWKWTSDS